MSALRISSSAALASIATLAELMILAPSGSADPIIFDPHVEYSTAPLPRRLTVGDLDGDGRPDIATGNPSTEGAEISVLLNLGDGTFAAAIHYPTGGNPRSPAIGDVDGDGDRDLVVALQSQGFRVAILRNDGQGNLGAPELIASVGGLPEGTAVVDLDGDDDRDIVFAQASGDEVVVLLNQGGGSFAPPVTYGGVSNAYFVHPSVGDVDGDEDPDLVVGRSLSPTPPSLYRNRGDGTFDPPEEVFDDGGFNFAGNDLGDLDGDGDLDLVLVSESGNWVIALRNDGSGSFSPTGTFPSGVETEFGGGLTLADLDGDQLADAIVPGANTYRLATLRSDGAGGFEAPVFHSIGGIATDVAAGPLDADQDLDLACGIPHQNEVSVLLNRSEIVAAVGPELEPENPASLGPPLGNPMGRLGTAIPYVLAEPEQVWIRVRDVAGRHVRSLFEGEQRAGRQVVIWDGRAEGGARVGAGIYLVELSAGGWRRTARVVMVP
jgi:hypothetical protein